MSETLKATFLAGEPTITAMLRWRKVKDNFPLTKAEFAAANPTVSDIIEWNEIEGNEDLFSKEEMMAASSNCFEADPFCGRMEFIIKGPNDIDIKCWNKNKKNEPFTEQEIEDYNPPKYSTFRYPIFPKTKEQEAPTPPPVSRARRWMQKLPFVNNNRKP